MPRISDFLEQKYKERYGGEDCSEIAEQLVRFLGNGEVIHFMPQSSADKVLLQRLTVNDFYKLAGGQEFKLEAGRGETFLYHSVYYDRKSRKIIDYYTCKACSISDYLNYLTKINGVDIPFSFVQNF